MGAIESGISFAALQQNDGTIPAADRRPLWNELPMWLAPRQVAPPMTSNPPRQYYDPGRHPDGATFRPSDWAERLAGAMSCFRPEGVQGGIGAFIGYSPYCVPRVIDGVKCVIVNEALRGIEPMAWDFVMNFARDNRLQVVEACLRASDASTAAWHNDRRARRASPSSCRPETGQAATASALILADRRLLWRAALFLWKMPLSATESITLCAALKSLGGLGLVAAPDGLLHVLDDGAELRTQRRVGGVQLDVLTNALAARGDANGLLLGFGCGGHAELSGCLGWSKDREYSIRAEAPANQGVRR